MRPLQPWTVILLLLQLSTLLQAEDSSISKRAITSATPSKDEVEGSGIPPNAKTTGYITDDEDTVEGSGRPQNTVAGGGSVDDEVTVVEGSGTPTQPDVVPVHPIHSVPSFTTTTSTTAYPPTTTVRKIWDIVTEEAHTTPRTVVTPITTTKRPTVVQTTKRTPSPEEKDDPLFPFHSMLKPGIFAAVVGGTVVGLLMAILLIMFIVYRMRKRDEGSYALEEPKQRPYTGYAYTKASSTKEFYA